MNNHEEASSAAGLQHQETGTALADSELEKAPASSQKSKQPEPIKFSNKCVDQLLRQDAEQRSGLDVDVEHYKDPIYNFEGSNDKSVIRCKFFDRGEDSEEDEEYDTKPKPMQRVESKALADAGARTRYLMPSEAKNYNYLGKGKNRQFKNLDDAGSTLQRIREERRARDVEKKKMGIERVAQAWDDHVNERRDMHLGVDRSLKINPSVIRALKEEQETSEFRPRLSVPRLDSKMLSGSPMRGSLPLSTRASQGANQDLPFKFNPKGNRRAALGNGS